MLQRRSSLTPLARVAALLFAVSAAPSARADDVDRCIAASEDGQEARRRRALVDARAAFIECSSERCPSVVRAACAEWLDQVDEVMPSVVVATVSPTGADVASATTWIDGRAIEQGVSTTLDPGVHAIGVRAPGFHDATMTFVAREGEKNRVVRVPLRSKGDDAVGPPVRRETRVQPVTWITGGLAAIALGSFAYFGLTGRSRADELRATCAPRCPEPEREAVQARYVVADVSLALAVILGGVSAWTLLSSHGESASSR